MIDYNICYSLDSQYAEQLAVSIASVLKNACDDENINFYILDGGLKQQDKANIELLKNIKDFSINYIEINAEEFKSCPLLKEKNDEHSSYHVTLPTYFRFKLPSLFSDLNKILYLDCDVIIRGSLKELFSLNIKNSAAAMVLDAESSREAERLGIKNYFNAGVMLINLDFWRENNIEEKLFVYAKDNADKILWQDQDIINVVLNSSIKNINKKWNYQYFLYEKIDIKAFSECVILHLAGRFKPWLIPFEHSVYDCYYEYLDLTAWKNNVVKYKQNSSGRYLKNNIGGSETNILLNATDEDIRNVYSEINKCYKYSEQIRDVLLNKSGEDLSKIYDEITKNYEYTNELSVSKDEKIESEVNLIREEITGSRNGITAETDEKITRVYDEISKNYDYTNELADNVKEEINKTKTETQEFVNKSLETLTALQDENISKIYEEITKNYDYTNGLNIELKQEIEEANKSVNERIETEANEITAKTDEKISKIYDEITKNYEYTNELSVSKDEKIESEVNLIREEITGSRNGITAETDEKITRVYDEISKNYDYTNELADNVKEEINKTKTETQEFVNKSLETLTALQDENISKIYEEITKNYDYTNGLNIELKQEIEEANKSVNERIETEANEITAKTDEKISKIYDEITKNYEYTNELSVSKDEKIESEVNLIREEITGSRNGITAETDEKITKVYDEINKNYKYTEKLVSDLSDKISFEVSNIQNEINAKIDNNTEDIENLKYNLENKSNELYSYINSQSAQVYNLINENNIILDSKIEQKFYENSGKIESVTKSLAHTDSLLEKKINREDVYLIASDIKTKLDDIKEQYQNKIAELNRSFEEELNQQRIKYEKKLIEMENILSELDKKYQPKKVSIFSKIKNKFKKSEN